MGVRITLGVQKFKLMVIAGKNRKPIKNPYEIYPGKYIFITQDGVTFYLKKITKDKFKYYQNEAQKSILTADIRIYDLMEM